MKPVTIDTQGSFSVVRYDRTKFLSESSSPWVKSKLTVTCPANVVRGNHKTPNAWNFSLTDIQNVAGRLELIEQNRYRTVWNGVLNHTASTVGGVENYTTIRYPYNQCLDRLYDQIRGGLDLSIDLLEYKESRKMVVNVAMAGKNTSDKLDDAISNRALEIRRNTRKIQKTARKIVKLTGSWKRTIAKGVSSISGRASNAYLAYAYGVKPLMGSMHDLVEKQITLTCKPQLFKATATRRETGSVRTTNMTSDGAKSIVSWNASFRTEIGLYVSASNQDIYALSQYTSLNPISMAYEMLTFSFVLDWVLDIGGYLRSAETAMLSGLKFHSGYRTDSLYAKTTCTTDDSKFSAPYFLRNHSHTSCRVQKSMNRQVLGGLPFPEFPSLEVKLGSERLFSAASLLRQLL